MGDAWCAGTVGAVAALRRMAAMAPRRAADGAGACSGGDLLVQAGVRAVRAPVVAPSLRLKSSGRREGSVGWGFREWEVSEGGREGTR